MPKDLLAFSVETPSRDTHFYLLPKEDPVLTRHGGISGRPDSEGGDEDVSPFAAFAPSRSSPKVATFGRLAQYLRTQIFAAPKKVYPQPVSEKEWFRHAEKIWDSITKSSLVAEYAATINDTLVKELT